mgnify:CR=1 FL=1
MRGVISFVICTFTFLPTSGQYHGAFSNARFPASEIDSTIIVARSLGPKITMLTDSCTWSERDGKKIDVFWLRKDGVDLFGHVYEYFMDCDNVRLIYWQTDPGGHGRIIDFMIEPREEDSLFVVAKKHHLKNKKKYSGRL